MVYKARHYVVIHNFSDLVFLFSIRTVVIMAYLIVISSSSYQQHFDFFFKCQYFQVLEEYISYQL